MKDSQRKAMFAKLNNPKPAWKPTPYSQKEYKCNRCGALSMQGTNHYGEIYNLRCPNCSWKNPTQPFVTMTCTKEPPAGVGLPPKWTTVRLGDVLDNPKKLNPKFQKYLMEYLEQKK